MPTARILVVEDEALTVLALKRELKTMGYEVIGTAGNAVTALEDDSGPGISPIHQAKLFEHFFTSERTGRGIGFGLSLPAGLWNFTTAPSPWPTDRGAVPRAACPTTRTAQLAMTTKRILVIDDEPGIPTR